MTENVIATPPSLALAPTALAPIRRTANTPAAGAQASAWSPCIDPSMYMYCTRVRPLVCVLRYTHPPRARPALQLLARTFRVTTALIYARPSPPPSEDLPLSEGSSGSEKGVRLAQKMRVGPRIPVGIRLERAEVGPTSGPTRRLSHFPL